jgi:hypothetical protein
MPVSYFRVNKGIDALLPGQPLKFAIYPDWGILGNLCQGHCPQRARLEQCVLHALYYGDTWRAAGRGANGFECPLMIEHPQEQERDDGRQDTPQCPRGGG